MKINRITLAGLLLLAGATGLHAAKEKAAPRTEVTYSEPEKFTDAANGPRGSDFGRDQILADLREFLVDRAQRYVPEGDKLSITITDVDLAGEIEPWRTPSNSDVRIVKPIYIPRVELSFKLTDASGAVVKEGTRRLSDPTFDMTLRPNRNDPRVYEKGLLGDWLSNEFRDLKKK